MINLDKSREFFNPADDKTRIHILGVGSVGSTIAEMLFRCGISRITLYDFDKVEAKNVHNQMFLERHIGMPKVEAMAEILSEINPDGARDMKLEPEGWNGKMLSGYIFLAVDNIDLRRQFIEQHFNNPNIKAIFDIRTSLTGAQHYAADWSNRRQKQGLLDSMNFGHEEVADAVSACGVTLGVVTTVRLISAYAVNNYIRFAKGEGIWSLVVMDGFTGFLDCI